MRLQIARARAANPPSEFFYPEGGETAEERNFSRFESAQKHTETTPKICTLADKPCVEQTLFEKFNRVGADAANDIIIYGSYYGLK